MKAQGIDFLELNLSRSQIIHILNARKKTDKKSEDLQSFINLLPKQLGDELRRRLSYEPREKFHITKKGDDLAVAERFESAAPREVKTWIDGMRAEFERQSATLEHDIRAGLINTIVDYQQRVKKNASRPAEVLMRYWLKGFSGSMGLGIWKIIAAELGIVRSNIRLASRSA